MLCAYVSVSPSAAPTHAYQCYHMIHITPYNNLFSIVWWHRHKTT